jgi:hypothetical protein
MYPVCPTMTAIATNLINLPFAQQIVDTFKDYSNDYEYTAEGVFRKTIPPYCPQCGKPMSYNGYNKYSLLHLAAIKLGRYYCSECRLNLQEENIFWENLKSDINRTLSGISQVLRNNDVSFECISDVMSYLIPQSRDTVSRHFSDSVANFELPEPSPIQFIHYDEQHPKARRSQKFRLTLLNGSSHEVIAELLSDNKSQEVIKSFFKNNLKEIIDRSTPVFVVTDMSNGYAELIADIFNGNAIHQFCLFHLNQIIAKEFSRKCSMKDELVKYKLFNIFYDRDAELNYLERVCEEEASINFRDTKEENELRRMAKIKFHDFLHEQELKRRREHKNLRLRNNYESFVIMNELLDNAHLFSPNVQRRLKKIQKDWLHFTAFQRYDGAPATNNAIENYYSTSLKCQSKKQLRSDNGLNLHMKLSSMRRFNMIGNPKITFLEILLKLIPFRDAG